MVIYEETDLGRITVVKDKDGNQVNYLTSFNTITKEARQFKVDCSGEHNKLVFNENKDPIIEDVILYDCDAYEKSDGKKIEDYKDASMKDIQFLTKDYDKRNEIELILELYSDFSGKVRNFITEEELFQFCNLKELIQKLRE